MKPAFGYLRVSGKGQLLDDADGFPRQRAAIERYAAANDFEIVRWFEERGVSGTTDWDERPAWVEMLASIDPGIAVIVERLDRLARDMGVQEHIIRDLKRRRVVLMSTAEPDLGSEEPTRVLIRQMLGVIAQYERAMIEVKLRHARERQRKKNGRCEGRKPFGQDPQRPQEVTTLQAIAHHGVTLGHTSRYIAAFLNERGLPTREGNRWHHATVAKILSATVERISGPTGPPLIATLPDVGVVPPSGACAPVGR
jgi:DNA invertase Pin-like site-specific DNA recombinase